MQVTNTARRLITIGETRIAPGATVELPANYEKNKVVLKLIAQGELGEGKVETKVSAANKSKKSAGKKNKALDDMTEDELVAYAEGKDIDLTGAEDKEGILALIKAAEA